jgi:TonB family protein
MTPAQLWNNIVAYALQVGLLVALGAIIPPVLKLRTPRARLLFWQTILASCVLLPWIQPWRQQVINASSVKAISAIEISQASAPSLPDSSVSAPPVPHQIPFTAILLCVLAAGVIVRIALLILGLVRLAGYRRRGHELVSDPVFRIATPTSARWLVSEEISSPVTFGWRDPVVLLPARFPSLRAELREVILCHELVHIERRDWMFTVAEELARAIFWFHPAVWWVLGEIQLAREQTVDQAVMEITNARDHYIDALLTMATSNSPAENQLDLAPAPLFLRRRHLKCRVVELLREVRISPVSRLHTIATQTTAIAALATACWLVSGAFPLDATPQLVADAAGVVVNTGDAKLSYRTPVLYPDEAIEKGVQGTVVVDAVVNRDGSLTDDTVVHCVRELCGAASDSLPNWRFATHKNARPQKILINFQRPTGSTAAPVDDPEQDQLWVSQMLAQQINRPKPGVRTGMRSLTFIAPTLVLDGAYVQRVGPGVAYGKILNAVRIGDSAAQLSSHIPVRAGDVWSSANATLVSQALKEFGPGLEADIVRNPVSQVWTLWIGRALPVPGLNSRENGAPQPAVILKVDPDYPASARLAGKSRTVAIAFIVGTDGVPRDVRVISNAGPELDSAAMAAASHWRFTPGAVATPAKIDFTFRVL